MWLGTEEETKGRKGISKAGIFICLLKHDWNQFNPMLICGWGTVKAAGSAEAKRSKVQLQRVLDSV